VLGLPLPTSHSSTPWRAKPSPQAVGSQVPPGPSGQASVLTPSPSSQVSTLARTKSSPQRSSYCSQVRLAAVRYGAHDDAPAD
jgi:hypothetical protein